MTKKNLNDMILQYVQIIMLQYYVDCIDIMYFDSFQYSCSVTAGIMYRNARDT